VSRRWVRPACRRVRGLALIVVLWAGVLITVLAASFAFSLRTEARLAGSVIDRAAAGAAAPRISNTTQPKLLKAEKPCVLFDTSISSLARPAKVIRRKTAATEFLTSLVRPHSNNIDPDYHRKRNRLRTRMLHEKSDAQSNLLRYTPQSPYGLLSRSFQLVSIPSAQTVSRSFYSIFRVLFNFPSRYLYAIGLPEIFSLRR